MVNLAIIGTRGIETRYSGVEVAVSEMCKCLPRNKFKITVYCRKYPGDPFKKKINDSLCLIFIPTLELKNWGTVVHVILSLVHSIFIPVNIVHFHSLGPAFFSFFPQMLGRKVVVTIHALDWKRKKWGFFVRSFLRFCEYPAIFLSNEIIVVSQELKKYFENKFKKQVFYIPNGAHIKYSNSYYNKDISDFVNILFVGRLVPEKRVELVIKAVNELKGSAKLTIAGISSFTHRYAKQLKAIAGKNIQFIGFIQGKALFSLYQKADIFVLPSEMEGSPVSLLEAMGQGKCVVASDIPECQEIIGECGVYFRAGDYCDLTIKIQYLSQHPEIISKLGREARERVKKIYDWDILVNYIASVYALCVKLE